LHLSPNSLRCGVYAIDTTAAHAVSLLLS
jgi:hypothetical protein